MSKKSCVAARAGRAKPSERQALLKASVAELVPVVGVTVACEAVGLPRASFYRRAGRSANPVRPSLRSPEEPREGAAGERSEWASRARRPSSTSIFRFISRVMPRPRHMTRSSRVSVRICSVEVSSRSWMKPGCLRLATRNIVSSIQGQPSSNSAARHFQHFRCRRAQCTSRRRRMTNSTGRFMISHHRWRPATRRF